MSASVAAIRGDGDTPNVIGRDTSADNLIGGETSTDDSIDEDTSKAKDNIFESLMTRSAEVLAAVANTVVDGRCPELYLSSILRLGAGMGACSNALRTGAGESGDAVGDGKNSHNGVGVGSILCKVAVDFEPNKRSRNSFSNGRGGDEDKLDVSQPSTLGYVLQTSAIFALSQSNVWDSSVDQSKRAGSDVALASAEYLSSICSLGTFEAIAGTIGVTCR